jgi:hypothetical protein
VTGADVTVNVTAGSPSIRGKQLLLSFNCGGGEIYKINHSPDAAFPIFAGEFALKHRLRCGAMYSYEKNERPTRL